MAKEKVKEKASEQVNAARRSRHSGLLSAFFALISIAWIAPILVVLLNSFKRKAYIFKYPFGISTKSLIFDGFDQWTAGIKKVMCGFLNYVNAFEKTDFLSCFGTSLFITVGSVLAIILFCSMTAWYLTRVHTLISKIIYMLCLFSMVVPFQMVMFTLSKFSNILHLTTPLGIIVVYLGFGAGLSIFMFSGFIRSISLEIEEAAVIDGCNPIQTFFRVIFPILKPTTVTIAILEAMWVWNDYLMPSLVLNMKRYRTIPIAVQYLKQSHGNLDWGAMMAVLVLAIIPIVIFYLICQKYIIEGVIAGAVKG